MYWIAVILYSNPILLKEKVMPIVNVESSSHVDLHEMKGE